jgi:hypothetical protein
LLGLIQQLLATGESIFGDAFGQIQIANWKSAWTGSLLDGEWCVFRSH